MVLLLPFSVEGISVRGNGTQFFPEPQLFKRTVYAQSN